MRTIKPKAPGVVVLVIGLVFIKTCDPASRIKSNLYFYLKHTMETLVIKVKSDKARRLIQDLEELDILEVMETSLIQKKITSLNVSDLKNKISLPMNEDAINEQIEKIRNEWQPNI